MFFIRYDFGMKKTLLIILLSFGLSSCVTTEDIKSVTKRVSNNVSVKETKEETKKIKFIQWKCYKYNLTNKYETHLLSVGYFPEIKKIIPEINDPNFKIGRLVLEDTSTTIPAFYSLRGVQHSWGWGLDNEEVMRYTIVIDTDGTGRFWDFVGAKKNQKVQSKEVYDCKSSETISVDEKDFEELIVEFANLKKD